MKKNETTRASLELMYDISRELASELDLGTVLQRVLLLSMRNVGAIRGSIIVLDDNGEPVESAIITGDQIHNRTTQQLQVTFERGLAGWVAEHKQDVLIENTSKDDRWLRRPDDAEDRTGPKSAVSVPIFTQGKLVGVVTLVHPTPESFTDDHLNLVRAIADQAGIAVINARLYSESQQKARVMTALANSAAVITASLKTDNVLQGILEQISQALRVEVVSLALIDNETRELVFRASTSSSQQSVVGIRLPQGVGIAGWVVENKRGDIVADAPNDPRFYAEIDQLLGFQTRAIACAPIRSQGKVIGVLEALNPVEKEFDPDALLVLTGIGSLAGTAMRHASLFERLQSAHKRYRELFEDSIDPILITNWEGEILEVNRQVESITGIDDETLHNMTVLDLQVVDFDEVGQDFSKLTSGKIASYEVTLHILGKKRVPVQVYCRHVSVDGVSHLQWILHDITERKKLDTMRDDLISMIYHDLRSPMGNVISSLDVLNTMLPTEVDPAFKTLLDIAVRSTERIQRLTSSLLDIRRLEAGQTIGTRLPFSPDDLINQAMDAVLPMLQAKKQAISVDVPGKMPDVVVNEEMIRRVLINLLENAIKYSPPKGKISVGASRHEDGLLIWVEDNGPGIPTEEKSRVFAKYARIKSEDGPKGYGLGLAYCRLTVEGHGGRIWVEDAREMGACFKFTLPIYEGEHVLGNSP